MNSLRKGVRNWHLVVLAAMFLLIGCGSSERRKVGIEELAKSQTTIRGLHILVSAGITKQEYSQRFEDVLLKLGDLDRSATETLPKFPHNDQPTVKAIYADISQSIEAYKKARDYFGDDFQGNSGGDEYV